MSYSSGFKINVNKLNANENLLVCLEITHSFLDNPLRLVNDINPIISNGNEFIPMPFEVQRQSDIQGELPQVVLRVANVGREMVRWVDSSGGGKDAEIKVMLLRRSTPNTVEESLVLGINSVKITTEMVEFNLIVQNNLAKRAMRYTYNKKLAPSLF